MENEVNSGVLLTGGGRLGIMDGAQHKVSCGMNLRIQGEAEQRDPELESSLGYITRPCPKKKRDSQA